MGNRAVSVFAPKFSAIGQWSSAATDLRAGLLVALAYYAGCLIGFSLRFPSSGIAYIWPPTAILLTSLLLLKPRLWPAAIGASLAAHGLSHAFNGIPTIAWLWQFAGNATQAAFAATVVSRLSDQPLRYTTLRSVTVFILGAAVAAPAIASLIPAYAYVRLGWASDFWTAWQMRTLTNLVTTVTLVPPLVTIFGANRQILERLRWSRVAEFTALLLGLLAAHNAAFVLPQTPLSGLPMSLVASMPFLAWAAARFSTPGLSVCLLAVGLLAFGNPADAGLPGVSAAQMIMGVQLFVGITASPLMFLAAALEESEHTRRAEAALHRSEAKNLAILRALPDLVFVLTKDDHRYVDFYCSNESELVVPPDQFIGKRMRDVFSAEFSHAFEEVFAQVVESGGPRMLEYSLPIQGEQRFYEARVVACDDDRLLSIVRDITERRRAEAALHDAQHALGRMSRASDLGELSASIAHEVRQPLSAIGANAAACLRWLEQDAADSRQLEVALADIVRDVGRAGDVIKRTRELFGSGSRENAPVEVNATIMEVLALTRHRVSRRGESIRTDLTEAPLWVMGDRVQLQQVLFNLVMNGLQAMGRADGAPGPLVVRSWRADGFVHVAVRDRGPGFAPSDADRIFEPFYTTKSDGLGIGLSISRSIIRAHGGTLMATLNGDGGATFEFRVPATPPHGALASARPVDAA